MRRGCRHPASRTPAMFGKSPGPNRKSHRALLAQVRTRLSRRRLLIRSARPLHFEGSKRHYFSGVACVTEHGRRPSIVIPWLMRSVPSLTRLTRPCCAALLLAIGWSQLRGQQIAARDSTARPTAWSIVAIAFTAGTLVAATQDAAWERSIGAAGPQGSPGLRNLTTFGEHWGSQGTFIVSGALWLGGRAFHDPVRARWGARALEAIALSGGAAGVIKELTGRVGPYADPGHPESWAFGRGFKDGKFQSFPSGPVTFAFAFASAITDQIKHDSPATARWAGPALYGVASVTAFARTYDHAHWLSDVVAGAGLGTLSGLAVSRWHRAHPGSWIDRLLLGR
jgi:membrane-associated phospholipid phosphatase